VLEGLSRNTGIHAAGVVIGDRPLDEFIPLCRGKENEVVTQYAMGPLTDLGMLKMDFLGLRTLTIMQEAVRLIHAKVPDFNVDHIPTDDRAAFDIYNRGETLGVFQMESGGITNCCKRFDVGCIEDIIAIGALYRPGPMQFIDDYIERKKGIKKVEYLHPLLEKVCSETHGIIVYQEQVQLAASVLAGYSLGEADLLRRAMGKKDAEKMERNASASSKAAAPTITSRPKSPTPFSASSRNSHNTASINPTAPPTVGFPTKQPISKPIFRVSLCRPCSPSTPTTPTVWLS
jgi:DNA polymerase-3 subunit alpha